MLTFPLIHSLTDIRHPEELSLLKKPRDPTKKKKKKLDDQSEDEALELEGPLITPGSGETPDCAKDSRQDPELGVFSSGHVGPIGRESGPGPFSLFAQSP